MDRFLDIFGFADVVLHAAALVARTVLLGGLAFWVLLAVPAARLMPPGDAQGLHRIARRTVLAAGVAAVAVTLLSGLLGLAALAATLGQPAGDLIGSYVLGVTGLALPAPARPASPAAPRGPPGRGRRWALFGAGVAVLLAFTLGSHAIARTEDRAMLLAATALHQAGAALWLGGLPCLLAALGLTTASARMVGKQYSRLAAAGVGLILLGATGFWFGYIGGMEAVYGTAYGSMAATKVVMLVLLLALGAANFRLLRRAGMVALPRLRRFIEAEMAIGIAVLAVAASLTSVPPAIDLPDDRVTWAEITERFTPAWPRLTSPERGDLAMPQLQARLDAEWQDRQSAPRPQAFIPGEGLSPPRNAMDIGWSEYNHHWSGIMVLLVGLAALADASGRVRLARHWPLVFLGLAGFILVRADPESWPFGEFGLLESLRDPEVVQHKLAGLLVAGFALSEWGVRLGVLRGRVRFVFPVAMLAGGVLLLAHTHAIGNIREAQLIELSHLPLAVLAVIAACARWTELRGPPELARFGRWIWPVCLVLVGLLLLIYREA